MGSVSQENQPYVLVLPTTQTSAENAPTSIDPEGTQGVQAVARALVDLIGSDRRPQMRSQQVVQRDGLRLDRARYEATLEGSALDLTLTEFNILWTLAFDPDRARTRQELVEASRGVGAHVQTRTIDAHIKSLRRKLGEAARLIETVRGIGYRYTSRPPKPKENVPHL
jgi:DNA-binding response OmpR family regulator